MPLKPTTQDTAAMSVSLDNANREVARLRSVLDNPDVVRMNKIYLEETVILSNQSPTAFKVLMVFVSKMTVHNSILISNGALEKITELSNSTVKRAIKLLRDESWIEVAKMGTSNVYRINSDIFWHETANGKWAEFGSHVVLSYDEQDDITKQRVPGDFTRHIPLVEASDYPTDGGNRPSQQTLGF